MFVVNVIQIILKLKAPGHRSDNGSRPMKKNNHAMEKLIGGVY